MKYVPFTDDGSVAVYPRLISNLLSVAIILWLLVPLLDLAAHEIAVIHRFFSKAKPNLL